MHPALLGAMFGAAVGGMTNKEDPFKGAIIGGLGGLVTGGATNALSGGASGVAGAGSGAGASAGSTIAGSTDDILANAGNIAPEFAAEVGKTGIDMAAATSPEFAAEASKFGMGEIAKNVGMNAATQFTGELISPTPEQFGSPAPAIDFGSLVQDPLQFGNQPLLATNV